MWIAQWAGAQAGLTGTLAGPGLKVGATLTQSWRRNWKEMGIWASWNQPTWVELTLGGDVAAADVGRVCGKPGLKVGSAQGGSKRDVEGTQ